MVTRCARGGVRRAIHRSCGDVLAADREALEGSDRLARMKSVLEKAREEGRSPLPENEEVEPERVVQLGDERPEGRVREGRF